MKQDIRMTPVDEIVVRQAYRNLLPRPGEEDFKRLREGIDRDGLDSSQPLIVNSDLVLLDGYTRLQIARELKLEWVWVTYRDFEDERAEQLFIIKANLARRHLNTAQRAELGLRLLEIEQGKARERQRLAGELIGKSNLKQYEKVQESEDDSDGHQLRPNWEQAGCEYVKNDQTGKALDHVARQAGVGRNTLWRAQQVEQAAQTSPAVAAEWEKAKAGESSVHKAYQVAQQEQPKPKKKYPLNKRPTMKEINARIEAEMEAEYQKNLIPHEELMYWMYRVADCQRVPREHLDGALAMDEKDTNYLLHYWKWALHGWIDPRWAWDFIMKRVRKWRELQRAARPEEVPVPTTQEKIGPWNLDFVHQGELKDLVEQFPENTVHLIYSDVLADLEQVELLGRFAARVLAAGKYLCVYVGKRHLPEAMSRLSALGLQYFWSCAVFRPHDRKAKEEEYLIREKWRLLLIYRQKADGGVPSAGWDWFEDAVECNRPLNRELVRQLFAGLTRPGQLVVDPLVQQNSVVGLVARQTDRRYLCFGRDEAEVQAINKRLAEVSVAPESAEPPDDQEE